jgi:hypothetical protein
VAFICPSGTVIEVPETVTETCPKCGEETLVTVNPWDGEGDCEPSRTECENPECLYSPDEDEEA